MTKDLPKIANKILIRLNNELDKTYFYHSGQHTLDVINECLELANTDLLSNKQIELLTIAAAFHDSGFLEQRENNEEIGAAYAEQAMLEDGSYSKEEIEEVKKCILSTNVGPNFSRTAQTELSKYLLDADLGSLGREDALQKTELLAKEENADLKTFLNNTLLLMTVHQWLTPAAQKLRQAGKEKNIRKIKQILSS